MKSRLIALAAILLAVPVAWAVLVKDDDTAGAGRAIADVRVPTLSAVATAGQAVFDANCAACHGDNAAGRDGAGPPLVHKIYEPNHHSDAAFFLAARQGVRSHHWPFGNMPPVAGVSDDDVALIVAYVRELQRANGVF
ncbi:MAG: cytochrome c [Nitratireductor sp.]|nr:cytochrome c [Nitratireductor sp.]